MLVKTETEVEREDLNKFYVVSLALNMTLIGTDTTQHKS